jgi:hypothetical protein
VGPTGDNGAGKPTVKIRTGVVGRLLDDFTCVRRRRARLRLDANPEFCAMLSSRFGEAESLGSARSRDARRAGGPKDPSHGR